MKRAIKRLSAILLVLLAIIAVLGLGIAYFQGRRTPGGQAEYVALGSSFAAGAGLGSLQSNSPWLCARSVGGYPQLLARMRGLAIVDMSCGGGLTRHLLRGGQYFQGPQIRVIGKDTKLVTVTVGGNDVAYVGDLSMLAARRTGSLFGRLVKLGWDGPKDETGRDFAAVKSEMIAALRSIRKQAPDARILVVTYPTILPPRGTCPQLGLDEAEARLMAGVGDSLAEMSRDAAREAGAELVDMHRLGAAHHVCSGEPWVNGWANGGVAPFHPNAAGAKATAEAVSDALGAAGSRSD